MSAHGWNDELLTRVIGEEANGNPTTRWNSYSVPLNRVNKIELGRILFGVIVSESLANNEEIESMEVERVALCADYASVLHHQLDARIEREHHHLSATAHQGVVRWGACVIELEGRIVGEVSGVDTLGLPKEVGLEEGCGGLNE